MIYKQTLLHKSVEALCSTSIFTIEKFSVLVQAIINGVHPAILRGSTLIKFCFSKNITTSLDLEAAASCSGCLYAKLHISSGICYIHKLMNSYDC